MHDFLLAAATDDPNLYIDAPHRYADEQVCDPFVTFHHEHLLEELDGRTHMQDRLTFAAPFGPLGRLVEELVLRSYVQRSLEERNAALVHTIGGED
jgi:ligand-binding SRPBCC domain-containing protein